MLLKIKTMKVPSKTMPYHQHQHNPLLLGKVLLHTLVVLLVLLVVGEELLPLAVVALPTTITYDMLQRMNGVPSLGRGYSVSTNSMHSVCLQVEDNTATDSSYNYDYTFTVFSKSENFEEQLHQVSSKTFAYQAIKDVISELLPTTNHEVDNDNNNNDNDINPKQKYAIIVTMRIDRFYTTLLENKSTLYNSAKSSLNSEEYATFFITCGPNYIRSLRRAQEVTAIFQFEEDNYDNVELFVQSLQRHVYGNNHNHHQNNNNNNNNNNGDNDVNLIPFYIDDTLLNSHVMKSLTIDLHSYGTGLNYQSNNINNSNNIVTTSLDEFNAVMRHTFNSMIKTATNSTSYDDNDDDNNHGLVYEMEVVPWVDNPQFIQLAKLFDHTLMAPISHHQIENSKVTKGFSTCTSTQSVIDDFGKCCDINELTNVKIRHGNSISETKSSCQPYDRVPLAYMRVNLQTNAEFVSWMGSILQGKKDTLTTFKQCVYKLRSFPQRFDYDFLIPSQESDYDDVLQLQFTVKELIVSLDPLHNLDVLSILGQEIEEYTEMFYEPCISALYGRHYGDDSHKEPMYFMSQPWYNHKECSLQSCMDVNKVWDRVNGEGCVDGFLSRATTASSSTTNLFIPHVDDPHCAMTTDEGTGEQMCKHKFTSSNSDDNTTMTNQIYKCRDYLPQVKDGRGNPTPITLAQLMDYYCMPEIAYDNMEQADMAKIEQVDDFSNSCLGI